MYVTYLKVQKSDRKRDEDLVSVEISEDNPAVLLRNVETSVRRIKEIHLPHFG